MKKLVVTLCAMCFVGMMFGQSNNDGETTKTSLIKAANTETPVIDANFLQFFEGLVYIDGELKGTDDILALRTEQIETIELFKNEAAQEKFNSPAKVDVIEVVTRKH